MKKELITRLAAMEPTERIKYLKEKSIVKKRFASFEQARIITQSYKENESQPTAMKRALSFKASCERLEIDIDENELIVGNRTKRARDGVVFPEGGISWVEREIDDLPVRAQDPFTVTAEDRESFFNEILPYWKGRTLEDVITKRVGDEISYMGTAVCINQTDHAQGHIAPNLTEWLEKGPSGLKAEAETAKRECCEDKKLFYNCVITVMEGAQEFMERYAALAEKMAERNGSETLKKVAYNCRKFQTGPAKGYHMALQAAWFLSVLLQIESNASSFSPGRLDQMLYPYYKADIDSGAITEAEALEYTEALWLKFNQVVYLRNEKGARYFAGFPIGFNVAIGGQKADGTDASNDLTYIFLRAQEHIRLPQPNLSARVYSGSPHEFLMRVTEVISGGGGMPQVFNDDSIIPALMRQGIEHDDAMNYCIVGCVELTTQGNNLGWSDAAMFNMVKVLELTTNDGKDMFDERQIGPRTGYLWDFATFEEFEKAFRTQVDFFIDKMMPVSHEVDRIHAEVLPSAFLSSVIDDCIEKGVDVTAGGAKYNYSGIQLIQVANIADGLAALKKLVYDEKRVDPHVLHDAMKKNFEGYEVLRQTMLNHAPKYGNDVEWVDELASKWHLYFAKRLLEYTNVRGGRTQTGLYTVSAHVPMGLNVAATPDGRLAKAPLADGGVSPVYGRDKEGPTAVLKSVSKLDMMHGSNGTLLNMKFLPDFFSTEEGREKFVAFLRTFIELGINHAQFNVVNREDLKAAQKTPELFGGLTIRVAGYTAYFVELNKELQNEIIARTVFGEA